MGGSRFPGSPRVRATGEHASQGFTLLELLVALAVFSLLVVGLTQGLRFGLQGWQTQNREVQKLGELDSVDRLLRDLLSSVQSGEPGFFGDSHRMRFTGLLPRAAPPAIRVATMTLLVTKDGFLALNWAPPELAKPGKPIVTMLTPILDHVANIQLAYYAEAQTVGENKQLKAGWRTRWDDNARIPTMIRLHIDFVEGDPRHWPDFVIAPMVSAAHATTQQKQPKP